jgi:hypothetical protein
MQHVETGTARAGFLGAVNVGSVAADVLMLLTAVTFVGAIRNSVQSEGSRKEYLARLWLMLYCLEMLLLFCRC